jgi:hypothetical protein
VKSRCCDDASKSFTLERSRLSLKNSLKDNEYSFSEQQLGDGHRHE